MSSAEVEPAYNLRTTATELAVLVDLPGVIDAQDVCVELDECEGSTIHLIVPGRFRFQVAVPSGFEAAGVNVKFRKRLQQLTLTFPASLSATGLSEPQDKDLGSETSHEPAPTIHSTNTPSDIIQSFNNGFPARLEVCPERGRYLCATTNIEPGTLVYQGEAAASVVHDKYVHTHCHACFGSLDLSPSANRTCPICKYAVYCSEACMRAADDTHDNECQVLHAWHRSGSGPKNSRGLRLFIRLAYACHESDALVARLNLLQANTDSLPQAEAQRLYQMAQTVNRFVMPQARVPQDAMVKLISQAHVNLHGITDLAGHLLGTGLFIGAAMFNHSCAPTCAVSFSKGVIQVHAMQAVKAGDELSIGYVELYAAGPERRASLQAKKFFQCTCIRCTDPALLKKDQPLSSWVCSKCQAPISDNVAKCPCSKPFEMSPEERLSALATWRRMHDTAMTMLTQGHPEEARYLLISILKTTEDSSLHAHHTIRLESHRALVDLLSARRLHEPCLVQAKMALACMKAHLPRNHSNIAQMHEHLADAALGWAEQMGVQAPEAKALLTKAWKSFQRAAVVLGVSWGSRHAHVVALQEKMFLAKKLALQV